MIFNIFETHFGQDRNKTIFAFHRHLHTPFCSGGFRSCSRASFSASLFLGYVFYLVQTTTAKVTYSCMEYILVLAVSTHAVNGKWKHGRNCRTLKNRSSEFGFRMILHFIFSTLSLQQLTFAIYERIVYYWSLNLPNTVNTAVDSLNHTIRNCFLSL